ncbi:autoinducer binding domain-containing protein [Corallococcus terminator]
MVRWEDSWSGFHQARNEQELFTRVEALAQERGFDSCCDVLRMPWPVSSPAVAYFDSQPLGWMNHYRENDYLRIDPVVRLGASSTALMVWSESLFASAPHLWTEARGFGLGSAVSQSSWAAHGVFGLLTFARRAPEPLSESELEHLRQPLLVTTHLLHTLMLAFLSPRLARDVGTALTAREREVLLWTGDGKTAGDIGAILSISERTVNFHINNALLKLNATNKVQAVVKALALGLIHAG